MAPRNFLSMPRTEPKLQFSDTLLVDIGKRSFLFLVAPLSENTEETILDYV